MDLVTQLVNSNIRSAYKGDTLLHLSVSSLNVIKSSYFQEDMEAKVRFIIFSIQNNEQ